jgi:hypothetical protein
MRMRVCVCVCACVCVCVCAYADAYVCAYIYKLHVCVSVCVRDFLRLYYILQIFIYPETLLPNSHLFSHKLVFEFLFFFFLGRILGVSGGVFRD